MYNSFMNNSMSVTKARAIQYCIYHILHTEEQKGWTFSPSAGDYNFFSLQTSKYKISHISWS